MWLYADLIILLDCGQEHVMINSEIKSQSFYKSQNRIIRAAKIIIFRRKEMKKYQPIIASIVLILSMICVPVLASTGSVPDSENSKPQEVFAESPNITVADQFGVPVSNVKINVLYEAGGTSKNIQVTTPQNGFVPISGNPGTYTFTVSSVPEGYRMTDQKIVQTYQDGASFSGKQMTVYRNDNSNPAAASSPSAVQPDGGNFVFNPTLNFSTDVALEFKVFLKDIVKEVMQEIEAENKPDAAPAPTPTPVPEPTPTPTPTPAPLPSVPSQEEQDFDLICAIVAHEGGISYDGAMAIISCVMNRVDAGWGPDAVSILTAPGQFASYLDGYYKQYLGNCPDVVKQAVRDCMENGVRSHSYLSFRSYQTSGSVNIAGNWYF